MPSTTHHIILGEHWWVVFRERRSVPTRMPVRLRADPSNKEFPECLLSRQDCCRPRRHSLLSTMKITFSFYERPRYGGRQDRAPMSHNSRDSIRAELEVLACSCLRRPQPPCRMHLPQHGLSLQIQHGPLEDQIGR